MMARRTGRPGTAVVGGRGTSGWAGWLLVVGLVVPMTVLAVPVASAQQGDCHDGPAHVGTFRAEVLPHELVVASDGAVTVEIDDTRVQTTPGGLEETLRFVGSGTGRASLEAGLVAEGSYSVYVVNPSRGEILLSDASWSVELGFAGDRWSGTYEEGWGDQPGHQDALPIEFVRVSGPDAGEPCEPVAEPAVPEPAVREPSVQVEEPAPAPAAEPADDGAVPVVPEPEGRVDAAPGSPPPSAVPGPGAPTLSVVPAGGDGTVLGMEAVTAASLAAMLAAGLVGMGQVLLAGAQAAGGAPLPAPGAAGVSPGPAPEALRVVPEPVRDAGPSNAPVGLGGEVPSSWVEVSGPDGSSTRRETFADGRVVQTRVAADGHRVVTQWWPDGRVERVEDTRAAAAAAAAEVGPAVPGAVGDELLGTPSEQQATVPASAPAPDDGTLEQPAPDAGPGSDQETVLDTDPDEEPESEVASEEEPEEEPASEVEPEEEPAPPTDRELMLMDVEFNRRLRELVAQLRADGYYVMNRNAAASAYNRLLGQYVVDPFTGHTGGTCGDFVDWGEQWLEPLVREVYGDHAVLSQISVESSSMRNHTANRIVTRNADNVVDLHYILSSEHRDGWTVDAELWFERNARAYRSLGGRPAEVAIDPSTGTMDGLSSLESSLERLLTSPRGEQLLTEQGLDGILDGWVDRASGSERTQRQVVADAFRRRGSMQHLYARALGPRLSAP